MTHERVSGEEESGRSEVSGRTDDTNRVLAKKDAVFSVDRYGRPRGNVIVRSIRSVFGYRKTSLTFFCFVVLIFTTLLSYWDTSLEFSVPGPRTSHEKEVLADSWAYLQELARHEHTYASHSNDAVHGFLQKTISGLINKDYMELDNDLNNTNTIYFKRRSFNRTSLIYYESNNLVVRINGSDSTLPSLLVSAHYDSVPTSFGVTDDGMGVASLLGLLRYYTSEGVEQPKRTIVLNFNNNEEFGLYGAKAFLGHPWASGLKYFLNLEGTGAGGKAVLFRTTDYGIAKFFKAVRYPFASSILQQGFANGFVHSDTDYHYYAENGRLRGLDLAFYKPRDIYHTAKDNINNVNSRSLWHMLSNTIDFTLELASKSIDLDTNDSSDAEALEAPIYSSFLNWFFIVPSSALVTINVVLLTIIPIISLISLLLVFNYKRNWKLSFINSIKYPVSLVVSASGVALIDGNIFSSLNEFLPNSNFSIFVATYFSLFLLLNYLILNGLNSIFSSFKVLNHDEKLIVMIQTSFIYWLALVWSTKNLAESKFRGNHSGEFALTVLFSLQSLSSLFGIFSWLVKGRQRDLSFTNSGDERPLLNDRSENYGTHDQVEDQDLADSVSSSSLSNHSFQLGEHKPVTKTFSYDWSIQFILLVPISSFVIYHYGTLILSCINKSIQESATSENYIYKIIQVFAIVWALPFLPFVFKLNRIFFLFLAVLVIYGSLSITFSLPFDQSNPMKLRFIQRFASSTSEPNSVVEVYSRSELPLKDVINEFPSYRDNNKELTCQGLEDGMQSCSYKTDLIPYITSEQATFDNLIDVDIMKNTSLDVGYPFGLLMTELKVNAPNNRVCDLIFNVSDSTTTFNVFKNGASTSPVTTVIVYADNKTNNGSSSSAGRSPARASIKEGFSRDSDGNYIFKELGGISEVELNKLDWDKSYHLGIQWIPNFVETDGPKYVRSKLGVRVECYWSDLGTITDSNGTHSIIPAYEELLHFSPNYVSWANRFKGLVVSSTYIEL